MNSFEIISIVNNFVNPIISSLVVSWIDKIFSISNNKELLNSIKARKFFN